VTDPRVINSPSEDEAAGGVGPIDNSETAIFVRVANRLLGSIDDGTFPVGDRLPSEQVLANHFGVSRPSLREALSALQFAGHLVSKQGFGTVVLGGSNASSDSPSSDGLSDPVEVLQARLLIEPRVIAVAALNPDERHLSYARSILDGMWLAVGSAAELDIRSDVNLHIATINICRNRMLRRVGLQLLEQTNPPRWAEARAEVWRDRATLETWATEHEATYAAIVAGDPGRASRCCRRHLISTIESLVQRTKMNSRDRKRLRGLLAAGVVDL
jgi:DNA-binding FadR family transcriptional regulator